MLKKSLIAFFLACFLSAAPALAAPGHEEFVEGDKPSKPLKIQKKLAKKELKRIGTRIQKEVGLSQRLWREFQPIWEKDRTCVKNAYEGLSENSPITDVQALYTLLGFRAVEIHTTGPDRKTHSSFREARARLKTLSLSLKTPGMSAISDSKKQYMNGLSSFPRVGPLCPKLQEWHTQGQPDLQNYFSLHKYFANVFLVDELGVTTFDDDIFFIVYNPRSNKDYSRMDKRINWFQEKTPYAEALRSNIATWQKWVGEIDLD